MLPYLRATEHGELCQEDTVKVVVMKEFGLLYTLQHTHYTLSVAIALGHLLLTIAQFAPAVRASHRKVRASIARVPVQ